MKKIPKYKLYVQELGEGVKRSLKLFCPSPKRVMVTWVTEYNIDGKIQSFNDFKKFSINEYHPTLESTIEEAKRQFGIKEEQLVED